jgi:hypothetical protein
MDGNRANVDRNVWSNQYGGTGHQTFMPFLILECNIVAAGYGLKNHWEIVLHRRLLGCLGGVRVEAPTVP